MARALYIRHAQASYMADDYDQLSDLGYKQSSVLGEYMVNQEIELDRIYIGPLKRHHQTYSKVLEAYSEAGVNLPEPEYLDELVEHQGPEALHALREDFVAQHAHLKPLLQEKSKKNNLKIFTYFMQKWATDSLGVPHPPHLQKWSEFKELVYSGVPKITSPENKGKTIACFTSGGTISAMVGYALGMDDDAKMIGVNGIIRNTSINEFIFSENSFNLLAMNQVPHLPDHMKTFV